VAFLKEYLDKKNISTANRIPARANSAFCISTPWTLPIGSGGTRNHMLKVNKRETMNSAEKKPPVIFQINFGFDICVAHLRG
jgi:hypothetical protein